ncbi:hypothetical protein L0Y49_04955 [bacterium]|nr:hypothetical protein [bacterium]
MPSVLDLEQTKRVATDTLYEARQRIDLMRQPEFVEQFAKATAALKDAENASIIDKKEFDRKLAIATATLKTVMDGLEPARKDLAEQMSELRNVLSLLGIEYESLKTETPEMEKVRNDAKSKVTECEAALGEVEGKWYFRNATRDRKVAEAQTSLERAKAALPIAEETINKMKREQLMTANNVVLLEELRNVSNASVDIMQGRVETINAQIGEVKTSLDTAITDGTKRAEEIQMLDAETKKLNADVHREAGNLTDLENGSPEYKTAEGKLAQLQIDLQEKSGQRQVKFKELQDHENYTEQLKTYLETLRGLRINHETAIKHLEVTTKYRVILHSAYEEVLKGAADEKIATSISDAGMDIDLANVQQVAQLKAASDKAAVAMFESHGGLMRELAKITAAMAESDAEITRRMDAANEDFKKKHGIDITALWKHTYEATPNAG